MVLLAALLSTAVFAAASIAVPTHARASACLAAGCGLPASDRPHGEIGTAEIAYRPQPERFAADSVAQFGSVSFASIMVADSNPAYFLTALNGRSRLRLF